MNTSILTRSVISLASLAIASVALAATPAAAAPAGVNRDLVLSAAEQARYSSISDEARTLVDVVCGVTENDGLDYYVDPLDERNAADGLLVHAIVNDKTCTFAAFAATESFTTLSGTATLTGIRYPVEQRISVEEPTTIQTSALSGDVFVTTPVDDSDYYDVNIAAAGNAITTTSTTSESNRVVTPKTSQQKAAARKVYDHRLASAKKAYTKAVVKAGSSSSKKAAAKKTYRAKKAAALAAYRASKAGTLTIVVTSKPTTVATPFTLTTDFSRCDRLAKC
ncbi:hypothetical protein [Aeromicrobium fastidiosum]|uniref:Uncharacterized protein n=1 Tax=Aeromicrobium fastidiosum TaxID=52699 RepID=A0A641ASC6_9ACTN|nr:hypothetical protein [Aeromicrobium fastidiosum]KAA1380437.1 hypothetical protein ESP62_004450 [Aeromicrobium fastidiosum]MBP2390016.1 hypothetical protein [Aeromicrobium fastidiosum]